MTAISLKPIGIVNTPHQQASGTPVQPCRAVGYPGTLTLNDPAFEEGLVDLEGFDRIWVIYYFDRAADAKMTVVPYRDDKPHGLFATRAPARPNPIGMSCVKLEKIEGLTLHLTDVDMLDGTPVLDIKPYVPAYDNYPVARCGWTDDVPDRDDIVADSRFEKQS
jgi:tRNA-Thr(GGU) m(6)t(6)A37 methyltransferase TsaA